MEIDSGDSGKVGSATEGEARDRGVGDGGGLHHPPAMSEVSVSVW